MQLDRAAAVAQALAIPTNKAQTTPPAWIHRFPPLPKHWNEAQRKTFREGLKADGQELKACWYRELLTSRSPLLERMTLWGHNHFTSSLHKVKWPPFLYQQNVLLRLYALGSFRTLLTVIAKNPAMLLYLDTQSNRNEHPMKILPLGSSSSSRWEKVTITNRTSRRPHGHLPGGISISIPARSVSICVIMTTDAKSYSESPVPSRATIFSC